MAANGTSPSHSRPGRAAEHRPKKWGSGAPVTAAIYTENLEAYHHYLQGRYHWFARTKGGLQRAMQYFEQAIEKDSSYALAYFGLADLHSILGLYGYVRPSIAFSRAGACAERALSIDRALAEGHFSSASKTWPYDFDWVGAERGFRRSLELNPKNPIAHVWYAHLLIGLGRDARGAGRGTPSRR